MAVKLHSILSVSRYERRSRSFGIAAISESIVAVGNRSSEPYTGLMSKIVVKEFESSPWSSYGFIKQAVLDKDGEFPFETEAYRYNRVHEITISKGRNA